VLVERIEAADVVRVEREVGRYLQGKAAAKDRQPGREHRLDGNEPQRTVGEELEEPRQLQLEPAGQLVVMETGDGGLDGLQHRCGRLDLGQTSGLGEQPRATRGVPLVGAMIGERRPHPAA
jgi:hypothetical protein